MFGGARLGRIAGIPFFIHPTWVLVFGLVTYSLSTDQLPGLVPHEPDWTYWLAGTIVALLFFGSLVAHEIGHSLVAKAYGIPVLSITLHIFGGVAALGREVGRAREELWIALAGPAVSVVLATFFWTTGYLAFYSYPIVGVGLQMLGLLNTGIVVFNMIPGFPLDGGRVLRSAIWGLTGSYLRATWVSSLGGTLVGGALVLFSVYSTIRLGQLDAMWMGLMGLFLVMISRQSYSQAVIQDRLRNTSVSNLVTRLITVPGALTLDELYAGYISTTGRQYYRVVGEGQYEGIITPYAMARAAQGLWPITPLYALALPLSGVGEVSATETAARALAQMEELRAPLLRVTENGETTGVLTRESLLQLALGNRGRRR